MRAAFVLCASFMLVTALARPTSLAVGAAGAEDVVISRRRMLNSSDICPFKCASDCLYCNTPAEGCIPVPDGQYCGPKGAGTCTNGICSAGTPPVGPVCPASCGECKECTDPKAGCVPVTDGRSCGKGAGTCGDNGICEVNTPACPEECDECNACTDPEVGCVSVDDGTPCADGAGTCTEGACVEDNAAPSPEPAPASSPPVRSPPPAVVSPTPVAPPTSVSPSPAPKPEELIENDLCTYPPAGVTGAYAPIKPSDVPDGIDEIVTNEFMANNITYNSEPFVGCDTYNSTVLQACSQVVAGTNYHVLIDISCRDPVSAADSWESVRTWDNGVKAAWVEAKVFVPLDVNTEPAEVTYLAMRVARLPPTSNTTVCPTQNVTESEGYEELNWKKVPRDVKLEIGSSAVSAGMVASKGTCTQVSLTPTPKPCIEALPDEGQAYWLGLDLTCLEGEFENQADVLGVGIIVQDLGGDLKNETSIQTIIELKPVSVEDV